MTTTVWWPSPDSWLWYPVEPERPPLRSTKTRRRGWTPARQERFDQLIERYRFDPTDPHGIDVLDIGVGHGESTLGSALQAPSLRHVAVELHVPGLGRLMDALERTGLSNVLVVMGDARDLLAALPRRSVGEIRVLFPDPWPKARHHVRRLIRPEMVMGFARVLRPRGVVHLATDHADYAQWMQQVMQTAPGFVGGAVERPTWRVDSRYALRAATAGRSVVDLRYYVTEGNASE
jgi:tRNA (guanine-N7-)-methyltransferase